MIRVCKKCGAGKPIEEFCKSKQYYEHQCKECSRQYKKQYRTLNLEKIIARQAEWRNDNRGKIKSIVDAYRLANREKVASAKKASYQKNKSQYHEYAKKWKEEVGYYKKKVSSMSDSYIKGKLRDIGVPRDFITAELVAVYKSVLTLKRKIRQNENNQKGNTSSRLR